VGAGHFPCEHAMEGSEAAKNISTAFQLKDQGNAAFKEGDFPAAISAYHQIFMYVNGYSSTGRPSGGGGGGLPGQTTKEVTPEEMAQIKELKVAHHCNLAMCFMKHGPKYAKARDNCTKALAIDPDHVKALFRRGKCYAQLNALDEAKADFDRVLQLQPDNTDAKRELRNLAPLFAKLRKKEAKKFAGMFDRINHDEEVAEAAAADAAAAAAASTLPTPPPPGADIAAAPATANATAALANPAASGVDVTAGTEAGDIGERLREPEPFVPFDVHYAPAS